MIGLLGLVVVAMALAACGGDDSNGSTGGSEPLSHDEYVAAADAICEEAGAELDSLGEPSADAGISEVADLFSRAAEIQEDQLNELRLLRPPEEDQEAVSQALQLLGQISQIAKDSRDALAAGDIAQLQELAASIEPLQAESTQIAQDLGLQVCGADDE